MTILGRADYGRGGESQEDNLDSASSDVVLDAFDELHADGITIAVITHDTDVSARAQRTVRIVDGKVSR